jgi:hypothetical protein
MLNNAATKPVPRAAGVKLPKKSIMFFLTSVPLSILILETSFLLFHWIEKDSVSGPRPAPRTESKTEDYYFWSLANEIVARDIRFPFIVTLSSLLFYESNPPRKENVYKKGKENLIKIFEVELTFPNNRIIN